MWAVQSHIWWKPSLVACLHPLYQAHKGALILRIFGGTPCCVVPLDLFSGILATTVRTGPNTLQPLCGPFICSSGEGLVLELSVACIAPKLWNSPTFLLVPPECHCCIVVLVTVLTIKPTFHVTSHVDLQPGSGSKGPGAQGTLLVPGLHCWGIKKGQNGPLLVSDL